MSVPRSTGPAGALVSVSCKSASFTTETLMSPRAARWPLTEAAETVRTSPPVPVVAWLSKDGPPADVSPSST